jgi:predicted phosphodiesterase
MRISLPHTGISQVVVLPDVHIPVHDKRSVDAVMTYVKRQRGLLAVVILGDLLDLNCISAHNKNNLRALERERITADYAAAREFLTDLRKAVGPRTHIVWLQGNHEERVERFINACPSLEGALEIERNLGLERLKVVWVPFQSTGESVDLGKATFIHGLYVNEMHAKKHVLAWQKNVFYGHTHDVQCYPLVSRGDNHTKVGQSLGCLCAYNQSYMKGKPTKWQQAFGVFYFQPSGQFNYYIPQIFNHRFIGPDGREYQG